MNEGLILGKFAPLTNGHLTAFSMALAHCYELNVLVCIDHIHDPECNMTAEQRVEAVKAECAKISDRIKVSQIDCTAFPYEKESSREISKFWAPILKEMFPKVTTLFGSEDYVQYIAEEWPDCMGMAYQILDKDRKTTHISATMVRSNPREYWDYIPASVKPYFTKNILVLGAESCVDAETEFFNGFRWIKISEYNGESQVLQYNADGTSSVVDPIRYIKTPCEKFWKIQNSYGNWSQVFSDDHDIVSMSSRGTLVKTPCHEVVRLHQSNKSGFKNKLLTSFITGSDTLQMSKLNLSQKLLQVAISADGTLSHHGTQWRVRVCKERKIIRMRELIAATGVELDERIYGDGYSNFYLPVQCGLKQLPMSWMNLNPADKVEIVKELANWDGCKTKSGVDYFTTLEANRDTIMTLASSCGLKVNCYTDVREDRKTCYRLSISFTTKYRSLEINKHNEQHRDSMMTEVPSVDGMKYCFTVPSGMLILRRDNHIFITGNCGKTTLTRALGKIFHAPVVPEMYRSIFPQKGMDFTAADLVTVARIQTAAQGEANRSFFNKGVVFHDTCCDITHMYGTEYFPTETKYNGMVKEYADVEVKFDLVLFCDIDVPWENDGTRTLGNEEHRIKMRNKAYSLAVQKAKRHGCEVVKLHADYKRLPEAIEAIEGIL